MTHLILSESFVFLTLVLCGMASSLLYSVLRALRRVVKKKFFVTLSDVVFSVATLVLLFFAFEKTCGGNIRFYQIAGFIVGFCIVELLFTLLAGRART